jgi:hypothetical protein
MFARFATGAQRVTHASVKDNSLAIGRDRAN